MDSNSAIKGFFQNNWLTFVLLAVVAVGSWYFWTNHMDAYYHAKHNKELDATMKKADDFRDATEEALGMADKEAFKNQVIKEVLEQQAAEAKQRGDKAGARALEETKEIVTALDEKKDEILADPPESQLPKLCQEAKAAGKPLPGLCSKADK